jgi:hypothetical protein
LLLALVDVGRFLIEGGRHVTMEPLPGVGDYRLRPYLLGSCLAAILHQRGILPLHGSAVNTSRGAILFLGGRGAGKSTAAATLAQRGHGLIADDLCAIVPDSDGWPLVLPGLRRIKLWRDAVERLGMNGSDMSPLDDGRDKFSIAVPGPAPRSGTRVHAMYLLFPEDATERRITELRGFDRVAALMEQTYRPPFLDWLGRRADHFRQIVAASRAPLFLVPRPGDPRWLDDLWQQIDSEDHRGAATDGIPAA